MNSRPPHPAPSDTVFEEHCQGLRARTDRMFAYLMLFQWVAGMLVALVISPRSWSGPASQTHVHVWAAIALGVVITSFPVALAWRRPGHWLTRHTIAAGQMLTSALLIHLTGGRIETHFHVFGSLAFLACYRDFRVLITATVVVAADHFLRGAFWPASVYGVLAADAWRSLEHAGWVIFIDCVLFFSIQQSLRDMAEVAARQTGLAVTNQQLRQEIAERQEAQAQLERTHRQLVDASRLAGKAEVATGVLHNVGNVLNSVNISAGQLASSLRQSALGDVGRVAALLQQHQEDLGGFLTQDAKGRQIPAFLSQLAQALEQEQAGSLSELESLTANIDHIKQIVAMQQSIARSGGVREPVLLPGLFEQSLAINLASLDRHEIEVVKEFADLPPLTTDRHQVLQVLVNLINNAKQAMHGPSSGTKRLTLRALADPAQPGFVLLQVSDTGAGIKPEHLPRLFAQGFTTKKDGHGFGLHSGALAAKSLGGALDAHSDGEGCGATFTLRLPTQPGNLQAAA